jgi:hypothetical protein
MKKIISILLVFAIVIGSSPQMSLIPVTAEEDYGSNGKFLAPIEPPAEGSVAISDRAGLESMINDLDGKYHLTADIDLSGKEWKPISVGSRLVIGWQDTYLPFTGTFDGQGHVIRNLKITDKSIRYVGLFGGVEGATIKNTGMEDTIIDAGDSMVGAICGSGTALIDNCYNTGSVSSEFESGGISGEGSSSNISNCYNTGKISGVGWTGGICGDAFVVTNSFNTGNIIGGISGGISGEGSVSYCYNTGTVIGYSPYDSMITAGGICAESGDISFCYNVGNVYGPFAGGIVGNHYGGKISNCYNRGNIYSNSSASYDSRAGGIFGLINFPVTVINTYNTGSVSAAAAYSIKDSTAGGIGGSTSFAEFINCYWNIDSTQKISGSSAAQKKGLGGGNSANTTKPLTTDEMKQRLSFGGFDFNSVWAIDPAINDGYPYLGALPVVTGSDGALTYGYEIWSEATDKTTSYAKASDGSLDIWVGGGNMKHANGAVTDNKSVQLNLYMYDNGYYNMTKAKTTQWAGRTASGKVSFEKYKLKSDTAVKDIAKISKGKVTAGKKAGSFYAVAYAEVDKKAGTGGLATEVMINVRESARVIELRTSSSGNETSKPKSVEVKLDDKIAIYPVGYASVKKSVKVSADEKNTYSVSVDPKSKEYIGLSLSSSGAVGDTLKNLTKADFDKGIWISGLKLKNNKDTKASLVIQNEQSGKKLKLTVNVSKSESEN